MSSARTITFIRCAEDNLLEVSSTGELAANKSLTETGKEQARKRRRKFNKMGISGFDLLLTSPVNKARETALRLLQNNNVYLVQIDELFPFPSEEGEILALIYNNVGIYNCLWYYFQHPDNEHLRRYGRKPWERVIEKIRETNSLSTGVVGHNMLLTTIAWHGCYTSSGIHGNQIISKLIDYQMPLCGSFQLTLDEDLRVTGGIILK